jgi:hypothetical protein
MRVRVGLVLAGLALGAAACSDNSAPPLDTFVGTWNATKMEFTRVANPTDKIDIIALGATFRITFAADSTWQAIMTVPETAPDTTAGTWTASIDVLTLAETGVSGNMQFTYVLSGNTISLSGANVNFDFGSGDEPATLSLTATKL